MTYSRRNKRILYAYLWASGLLVLSLALGLALGAVRLNIFDTLWGIMRGDGQSAEARILLYARLPRVLGAVVCGAALSVSGAVIQGVLANRLASPGIIGVNSGAGLAVTVCSALGIVGGWQISLLSFLGALVTALLVSYAAARWRASAGTLILMGVAVNALLGAVGDTVVTLVPEAAIMSNDFRIGDFSSVSYGGLLPSAVMIAVALSAVMTLTHELDALVLGEDTAAGLGVNTRLMRPLLLLLAALLAGAAVSLCGLLSFVGLLVPHAVRRISGDGYGRLLPLCALFGAGFITLCDTLARTVLSPYEIPVGIIMAFLGAPFFLYLLIKGKGGREAC